MVKIIPASTENGPYQKVYATIIDETNNIVTDGNNILQSYVASDSESGTTSYYGFVKSDGSWYIMKQEMNNGIFSYRFIKGDSDYETNWNNRASLTYDYFYNVFGE